MQQPRSKLKTGLKVVAVLVVAYFAAYAVNSALGGYWLWMSWEPMRQGVNPPDRIKRSAAIRWQPRFGYFDSLWRSDALGYFFAPLIVVDQKWTHRSHFATDPDFEHWSQNLPLSEVHPKHRQFFSKQP